ncbi:MAG TPA: PilZ domain-containing protein [Bauldia sp.]|nr:PilZ domain-containing protein [Bauldia sp.]
MTLTQAFRQRSLERRHDRRRHQRVRVSLLGRFMLEDKREYPCQTLDMSPGSVALITPVSGKAGERVVAYVDHIGRIEGVIMRTFNGGFAMSINATLRKKDKLAAKLTWLANRHELNLPEDRRHDRIVPSNPVATISLPDGRQFKSRVLDTSLSGLAVAIEAKPPIGSPVTVGKLRATVVRHFDEGIAVEFSVLQTRESIEANLG